MDHSEEIPEYKQLQSFKRLIPLHGLSKEAIGEAEDRCNKNPKESPSWAYASQESIKTAGIRD
ncbi:hypothetical protein SynBIOSE41_01711 [Synechococcus sp. BIOS-E4-1]|nr:hypothetical protein SynBIOSE41_01711 [Synechococcus sp. BIOS-E4-1]